MDIICKKKCKVCNEKTAKLLEEAFKMPGFTQIKI